MEKFAVDLDKVLDDFEFNEDCAEQIASINSPASNSTLLTDTHINDSVSSKLQTIEGGRPSQGFEISPFEKHEYNKTVKYEGRSLSEKHEAHDSVGYCEGNLASKRADPVNYFYPENYASDAGVSQMQCVYLQAPAREQIPVSTSNDISQTVLAKQHNESNSQHIQNRYDKKLNQPNIKPSVSNVFNSLNEYINAPTISLDYAENMLDKEESGPSEQSNAQDDECRISTSEVTIVDYQLSSNIAPIANDDDDDDDDDDDEAVKSEVTHGTIFTEQSIILPEHQGASFEGKEHRNKYDVIPSTSTQESKCAVESDGVNVDGSQAEKLYLKISNLDINSDGVERTNVVGSEVADLQHECTNVDTNDTVLKLTTESSAKANVIDEFRAPENIQLEVQDENASRNASQQVSSLSTSDTWTSRRKPIGFNDIDDLSEEELNTYLNKLEAEEESKGSNISNRYVLTESHGEVVNNSSEDAGSKLQLHSEKGKENITMDDKTRRESTASTREKDSEEKREEYLNVKPKLDDEEAINDEASNDILKDRQWVMSNDEKVKIEEKKEQAANEEIKDAVDKLRYEVAISSKDTTVVESRLPFDESRTLKMRNDEADVSQELSRSAKTEVLRVKEVNENKVLISEQNNNQVCEERVLGNLAYDIEDKHRKLRGNRTVDAPTNNTEIDKENVSKQNEIGKEGEKPIRPQTLDIGLTVTMDERRVPESSSVSTTAEINAMELEGSGDASRESADTLENSLMESTKVLGRQPPFWVPDSDAASCMLCDIKFTVLKRRHHCRACGKVLCKKCCSMKYKLQYQGNIDSRVCVPCYVLLMKADNGHGMNNWSSNYTNSSEINSPQGRPPNPNNPMEYCSTIPPLQQLAGGLPPPPTVMVPVGVLKREGSTKQRSEGSKSVMFSDGIRPGCDLTELDTSWDMHLPFRKPGSKRVLLLESPLRTNAAKRQNLLPLDLTTNSYIPQDPNLLPPTVTIHKGQASYHNATDQDLLYKTLKNECEPPVMFAINRNLYAYVKITNLNCCVNRICWNVTSKGLACVGQDEVILLVEALPDETQIPKDLLLYVNQIYVEATKGNTMTELSVSIHQGGNLLGSREHAGFLFIRQTLQCLQKIILPPAPFLIGLLIHRWETPWAKVFPLRLLLRLGAEYRYYPCPLVSVRFRDALYFEIGHTVMKVLADFRNFGYTLPGVRGLVIHLKNRTTDVMFPRNRYDQVIKGLNNSNDHVLAYASNFSIIADSHLVCIQTNTGDESSYQTQAINIQNKPRTVTGASFIVINGALKSSMGLSAKSSIVEDGLMVEIMPEKMEALKAALKNMQDFSIGCGRQGAAEPDETVHIKWVENDLQFNLGVKSPIDGQLMDGIPSIRVHNATDYKGTSRFIRWTEVFIIKSDDHPNGVHDPMDINKLSESIARATSIALVKLLDLLATAGLTKLGVRTTIHTDNVGYEAGSEGVKLPPIYMNSLDNELIQILHKAAQSSQDTHTVLELIFYILDD